MLVQKARYQPARSFVFFLTVSIMLHGVFLIAKGIHTRIPPPPGQARSGGIEITLENSALFSRNKGLSLEQQAHSMRGKTQERVFSGSTSPKSTHKAAGRSNKQAGRARTVSHPQGVHASGQPQSMQRAQNGNSGDSTARSTSDQTAGGSPPTPQTGPVTNAENDPRRKDAQAQNGAVKPGPPAGNSAGDAGGSGSRGAQGRTNGTGDADSAGRGGVFGAAPGVGAGPLHVVYVLDCSSSMYDGNKIGKAKAALKKALRELKPGDTFNVIAFTGRASKLSPIMLPMNADIMDACYLWIDRLRLGPFTNISGALYAAFNCSPINCVFLMSDGEPEGPNTIRNTEQLRQFVTRYNTDKARINTLALCLGERYPGEALMKGLAEDTGGDYNYIDLTKVR